jgi:hypothetical protein
MKVDNKSNVNVEFGFFDDDYNETLTEQERELLIQRKIERAKFYHQRNQMYLRLVDLDY